jgi:alpha-ribazole phosphatase
MEIFIIRHTTVVANREICYGQHNVALTNTFKEEAAALKKKLAHNFDAVFCSTLNRCTTLATELGFTPFITTDLLKEYNFGNWENRKWADLPAAELNPWMEDFVNVPAPGGENLIALNNRIQQFVQQLLALPHKKVLIITHAGPIRCFWSYLLQVPLQNIFKIPVGFGEVLHANIDANAAYNKIISKQ